MYIHEYQQLVAGRSNRRSAHLARHSRDFHADRHIHLADHALAGVASHGDVGESWFVFLASKKVHKSGRERERAMQSSFSTKERRFSVLRLPFAVLCTEHECRDRDRCAFPLGIGHRVWPHIHCLDDNHGSRACRFGTHNFLCKRTHASLHHDNLHTFVHTQRGQSVRNVSVIILPRQGVLVLFLSWIRHWQTLWSHQTDLPRPLRAAQWNHRVRNLQVPQPPIRTSAMPIHPTVVA